MSGILHVRCVVCGEVLSYQREDTTALLVHLRRAHPKLNLGRLDLTWIKSAGDALSRKSSRSPACKSYCKVFDTRSEKSNSSFPCDCDPGAECKHLLEDCGCNPCEPLGQGKKKGGKKRSRSAGSMPRRSKNTQKKKMYHTTVETWRPGNAKIVCPRCGYAGQPIVRRQRNKVYKSSVGALCMLGCWPICFIPFMLCGDQVVNLHCSQCNNYLGSYDRKKSELVQQNTCTSSTTVQSQSAPVICNCTPTCDDQ